MRKTIIDLFESQIEMMKAMEDDYIERPMIYYQGILFGTISTLLYFDQITKDEAEQLAREYVVKVFTIRNKMGE